MEQPLRCNYICRVGVIKGVPFINMKEFLGDFEVFLVKSNHCGHKHYLGLS